MIQKIALPDFLLTKEEYQSIKVPVMKNFNCIEKEKEENQETATDYIVSVLTQEK